VKLFGDHPAASYVRYMLIVAGMVFFVVLYVWQNIEVMKIKMDYRAAIERQRVLIAEHDRLIGLIEDARRMEHIDAYAAREGLRPARPSECLVIVEKADAAKSESK
jgi:hypothetical protein